MRLPPEISELVSFLEKQGLALRRKQGPDRQSFGNIYMEYGNGDVIVRVVLDRSCWELDVADIAQPTNWYSPDILRTFVLGAGSDSLLLSEQVEIIERVWREIIDAFSPLRREATHARLAELEIERAQRIYPPWTTAALELETLLISKGLTCRHRDAPKGVLGERLMVYFDSSIGVRVTCGAPENSEGWRVAVADAADPDRWYDVALIRRLLGHVGELKMPYDQRFAFLKKHWTQVRELFSASARAATHEQLTELLEE